MSDIKLSKVAGGGSIKPPTAISNTMIQGTASIFSSAAAMGVLTTSQVTSTTLTEVLNISGSGVLTFSGVGRAVNSDVATSKIRIVIDDVEVLNDSSMAAQTTSMYYSQVGAFNNNNDVSTEGFVVFKESLVVEIAGDGSYPVSYKYKRHLT